MVHGVDTPEALGALIRARRKQLGLTQADLAAVAPVSPRLLGEVENGKPTAQLDGVMRILAAVGYEIELHAR